MSTIPIPMGKDGSVNEPLLPTNLQLYSLNHTVSIFNNEYCSIKENL